MTNLIKFLMVIALIFCSNAFAHVQLTNSSPSDNAMLTNSPKLLSLTFGSAVRLVKVSVSGSKGEEVDFGFKPPKNSVDNFSWVLPPLSPANYEVNMVFLGQDGHKMKKSFNFMVH